jgi:hypothetical protein
MICEGAMVPFVKLMKMFVSVEHFGRLCQGFVTCLLMLESLGACW